MNIFGIINNFARLDTVSFYTLKREHATLSETDDFLQRMEKESKFADQLEQLLSWIEIIGNDQEGAIFDLFRPERNCVALPPNRNILTALLIYGFIVIG